MAITLVLEDGSGVTGANTYVSLADAVTYSTNWGNTAFTTANTDAIRIQALFAAAYALDRLYGRRYISVIPLNTSQGLLWPRYSVIGNDLRWITSLTIPQALKDAQCELANMYIGNTSLFPNESTTRTLKNTSGSIGELKYDNQYWNISSDSEHYDGFRKVELILWPILNAAGNDGATLTL